MWSLSRVSERVGAVRDDDACVLRQEQRAYKVSRFDKNMTVGAGRLLRGRGDMRTAAYWSPKAVALFNYLYNH